MSSMMMEMILYVNNLISDNRGSEALQQLGSDEDGDNSDA